MNPIARNILIEELIHALKGLVSRGNSHVDIMIDEEYTIRLRGIKDKAIGKLGSNLNINEGFIDPSSGEVDIKDTIA